MLHLREEVERLKRGLLGQKAERLPENDAQLSLLMLGLALGGDASDAAPEPPPVEQTVAEHTRAKPVRKPLPPNLPRVEIEIVPPEVEREPGRLRAHRHGDARGPGAAALVHHHGRR